MGTYTREQVPKSALPAIPNRSPETSNFESMVWSSRRFDATTGLMTLILNCHAPAPKLSQYQPRETETDDLS